jgi:hypothetical protein
MPGNPETEQARSFLRGRRASSDLTQGGGVHDTSQLPGLARRTGAAMPPDLIITGSIALPPIVLGSIALVKCDRKDIPEIIRWIFGRGRL